MTSTTGLFGQEGDKGVVTHYGVLREIMREQKIGANANLKDFASAKHLYALGALEGLSGEILIVDGKPFHGLAKKGEVIIDKGFDKKATLLVAAEVSEWSEVSIPLKVEDLKDLASEIARIAQERGFDTSKAFPFQLKGIVSQLEWHIINATEAKEQSHDAFKEAGLKGIERSQSVEILGFYSENHQGIFTHHGSFLHLHFKDSDGTKMGHVDQLSINGDIVLMLPKTNKP